MANAFSFKTNNPKMAVDRRTRRTRGSLCRHRIIMRRPSNIFKIPLDFVGSAGINRLQTRTLPFLTVYHHVDVPGLNGLLFRSHPVLELRHQLHIASSSTRKLTESHGTTFTVQSHIGSADDGVYLNPSDIQVGSEVTREGPCNRYLGVSSSVENDHNDDVVRYDVPTYRKRKGVNLRICSQCTKERKTRVLYSGETQGRACGDTTLGRREQYPDLAIIPPLPGNAS
ncbi:hypothetical protein EDD85DRAFT_786782 [Armillaria nabsnona]|nr:hypothetical protein EDD85DRAFT_786782 [Armillaria nabsnona]